MLPQRLSLALLLSLSVVGAAAAEPAGDAEPTEEAPAASEAAGGADAPADAGPTPEVETADAPAPADADADLESPITADALPPTDPPDDAFENPPPAEFPPKHSFYYTNLTAVRLNPLGLENRFQVDYRWRIYDNTESVLKKGSFIGFGVEPLLNPAITRVSAVLTLQPLAVLQLRAAYGVMSFFGTFDYLQSYNTPTAEHYTAEYESTTDDRYAATGTQAQFAALLQAKVGPIAIRNNLQAFRTDINLRDNDGDGRKDPVFYYIRDDIMIRGHGWHLINDTDVLYLSKFGLTAGLRATVVKPFYKTEDYLTGEPLDDPNGPTFRLGPLLGFTFFDRPEKRFNKPTILVISQWWIKHRYRVSGSPELSTDGTVERGSVGDSLPGMPTLVLGFAFQGQLWGKN
ncbi:MAG: hypothetical protein R3A79_07175 [Nannocystaceae bacterium]